MAVAVGRGRCGPTTDRAYQVASRVRVLHLREYFERYLRTRSPSAESLDRASPQSLRWLGARPASAGLCVSGAERRLPAARLADLTLRVREHGWVLTGAGRR